MTTNSTQEAVMHHRISWQMKNKTQPFDHKSAVCPILLQITTDLWNSCREIGSSCAGGQLCAPERCEPAPSPADSLVTSSLNPWCAHSKVRAPSRILQQHRFMFCSLFLPGIASNAPGHGFGVVKSREPLTPGLWREEAESCSQKFLPGLVLSSRCHPSAPWPLCVPCPHASGAACFRKMKIN